jgi:transformation/transcription domain-associated protein
MRDMPKLREYIKRLQWWRDTYEKHLDARPKTQALDQNGCNLIDFHHLKFDDVEIPGQYVQVSLPLRIKILNGADWAVAC